MATPATSPTPSPTTARKSKSKSKSKRKSKSTRRLRRPRRWSERSNSPNRTTSPPSSPPSASPAASPFRSPGSPPSATGTATHPRRIRRRRGEEEEADDDDDEEEEEEEEEEEQDDEEDARFSLIAPAAGLNECELAQRDELEVLRSMYMDDFQEITRNATRARWPSGVGVHLPHFKIKLYPHPAHMSGIEALSASSSASSTSSFGIGAGLGVGLSTSSDATGASAAASPLPVAGSKPKPDPVSNHVAIVLDVTYPRRYPEVPPMLQLEKVPSKGLADELCNELLELLEGEAAQLVGDVMIFELIQIVEEFLRKHNEPRLSFYDQMVMREAKAKAEEARRIAAEREKEERRLRKQRDQMASLIEQERQKIDEFYIDEMSGEDEDDDGVFHMDGLSPQPTSASDNDSSTSDDSSSSSSSSSDAGDDSESSASDDDDDDDHNPPKTRTRTMPAQPQATPANEDDEEEDDEAWLRAEMAAYTTKPMGLGDAWGFDGPGFDEADEYSSVSASGSAAKSAAIDISQRSISQDVESQVQFLSSSPHSPYKAVFGDGPAKLLDSLNKEPLALPDAEPKVPRSPATGSPPALTTSMTTTNTAATAGAVLESRYEKDFEELGFLGRGGFGEVIKVRHRVDGLQYAVKRIKLKRNRPELNRSIMREVLLIARLHHQRIVRYYQAWVETSSTPSRLARGMGMTTAGNSTWSTAAAPMAFGGAAGELAFSEDVDPTTGDWLNANSLSVSASAGLGPGFRSGDTSALSTRDERGHDSGVEQCLYIQMEYCPNKTLKTEIQKGNLSSRTETIWRLFRQILEGIDHIHAQGIMHRDIKPDNIFIDSLGNVKLGDFGLAVSQSGSQLLGLLSEDNCEDEVTEVVGTAMYRSPEQSAEGVQYDSKADMYALGIIFYEMWRPFSTLMERVVCLRDLRNTGRIADDDPVFGRRDEDEDLDKARHIIECLLQHKPSNRPTSTELLKSGLLPVQIEDEFQDMAVQAAKAGNSAFSTRLRHALFSKRPDDYLDYTFDYRSGPSVAAAAATASPAVGTEAAALHPAGSRARQSLNRLQLALRGRCVAAMEELFRRHGAVHFQTPLLVPVTSRVEFEAREHAACLLNPSGVVVQLPFTLTLPFARYVAHQPVAINMRRFDVAKVFRKNATGGSPKEVLVCDFDFVWHEAADGDAQDATDFVPSQLEDEESHQLRLQKASFTEAEAIKVVSEALAYFRPAIGPFVVRINHLALFDAILDEVLAFTPDDEALSLLADELASTGGTLAPSSAAKPGSTPPRHDASAQLADETLRNEYLKRLRYELVTRIQHSQQVEQQGGHHHHSGKKASAGDGDQSSVWSYRESALRKQLRREGKIPSANLKRLDYYLDTRSQPGKVDSIASVLRTLHARAKGDGKQRVADAVESLRSLMQALRSFGNVAHLTMVDVGLVCNYDLYRGGLVFQAVSGDVAVVAEMDSSGKSKKKKKGKRKKKKKHKGRGAPSANHGLLAVGGRYDSLIESLRVPNAEPARICAVGASIAYEKIEALVVQLWWTTQSAAKPAQTLSKKASIKSVFEQSGVLLYASKEGAFLTERVALAARLWRKGMRAEYDYPQGLKLHDAREFCRDACLRFVAHFRERQYRKRSLVRVYDMSVRSRRPSDGHQDVHEQDLVDHLLSAASDGSPGGSGGGGGGGAGGGGSGDMGKAGGSDPHAHAADVAHKKNVKSPANTKLDVDILDAGQLKAAQKQKVVIDVAHTLGPLLSPFSRSAYCVAAVDLPLQAIRELVTAAQRDWAISGSNRNRSVQTVLSSASRRSGHRPLLDKLKDYLNEMRGKKNVQYVFVFSIPERRADMVMMKRS